jgi:hypothetical protein
MFKKIAIFIFVFTILCVNVYAHSGRTDGAGGHTNHSTGEYHYHHGQPAHQHPDGICPYDDRYSDYSSEEEDNEIQTLEEYCEENGIELGPVKQQDNFDEEEILLLLLDVGIIVIVARWICKLVKKKRE